MLKEIRFISPGSSLNGMLLAGPPMEAFEVESRSQDLIHSLSLPIDHTLSLVSGLSKHKATERKLGHLLILSDLIHSRWYHSKTCVCWRPFLRSIAIAAIFMAEEVAPGLAKTAVVGLRVLEIGMDSSILAHRYLGTAGCQF